MPKAKAQVTTAKFPRPVLERLRRNGLKGQTYVEIATNVLDRIDRDEFIEEQFRIHKEPQREWAPLRRVVTR
jgi:hypothetical protein